MAYLVQFQYDDFHLILLYFILTKVKEYKDVQKISSSQENKSNTKPEEHWDILKTEYS